MNKKDIRKTVLTIRRNYNNEYLTKASKIIVDKLINHNYYKNANKVCLYMPFANEVDITSLFEISLENKKEVYLPKTCGSEMDFYSWDNNTQLINGNFGILEPVSNKKLIPTKDTLVIMPGAVFSVNNDRIGYGGGYYDRYLSQNLSCKKIAVCYKFQVLPSIPTEVHDIKPDYVLYED